MLPLPRVQIRLGHAARTGPSVELWCTRSSSSSCNTRFGDIWDTNPFASRSIKSKEQNYLNGESDVLEAERAPSVFFLGPASKNAATEGSDSVLQDGVERTVGVRCKQGKEGLQPMRWRTYLGL